MLHVMQERVLCLRNLGGTADICFVPFGDEAFLLAHHPLEMEDYNERKIAENHRRGN